MPIRAVSLDHIRYCEVTNLDSYQGPIGAVLSIRPLVPISTFTFA